MLPSGATLRKISSLRIRREARAWLARFVLVQGGEGGEHDMSAAPPSPIRSQAPEPLCVTLLEVVRAVGEVTDDDREVVATVLHLLATGQIRLCGNFRDSGAADFS
jgi:hypothetical protein